MSFVADMFGGSSQAQPAPVAPTRDTAADALAASEAEDKKRRAWQTGAASTQLTTTGGVPNELTGSRTLTSAG